MISEQLDFTSRTTIVTGGGTGIGYATALSARKGTNILHTDELYWSEAFRGVSESGAKEKDLDR